MGSLLLEVPVRQSAAGTRALDLEFVPESAPLSRGIFATSFGAAVGYLLQGPNDKYGWLPSHKVLDEVAYRAVIIGFPIFATLIILGSWWAAIAWGRYWGWDPKETSALVTWLIYAVYLHARNQKGWAGRPSALKASPLSVASRRRSSVITRSASTTAILTKTTTSVTGIRRTSCAGSAASKRQRSTAVACSLKRAKLTPVPSQVAPSG